MVRCNIDRGSGIMLNNQRVATQEELTGGKTESESHDPAGK